MLNRSEVEALISRVNYNLSEAAFMEFLEFQGTYSQLVDKVVSEAKESTSGANNTEYPWWFFDKSLSVTNRMNEYRGWIIKQAFESKNSLAEKLTHFWINHIPVLEADVEDPKKLADYYIRIRKHSLGNFKDMIHETSKTAAMLTFLNGDLSIAEAPNENYAREVMELFTLGEGRGYTDQDIIEAAKAFTGWRYDKETLEFYLEENSHDWGPKDFMGEIKNYTGEDIIETIFDKHPGLIGDLVVSKFVKWFCGHNYKEDHSADFNAHVEAFISSGFEISALVKSVLEGGAVRGRKVAAIKDAFTNILEVHHTYGVGSGKTYLQIYDLIINSGHCPFNQPSVAGYDPEENWVSTNTYFHRIKTLDEFVTKGADPLVKLPYDHVQLVKLVEGAVDVDERPEKPEVPGGEFIIIDSMEDLLAVVDNPERNYRLNRDIDMQAAAGFQVRDFLGTFDGNGRKLYNFSSEKGGVFKVNNGKIINLGIEGEVKTSSENIMSGLIVDENKGEISSCYANGKIQGANLVGGLVGHNATSAIIENCFTDTEATGINQVGGISGFNEGVIRSSYSANAVIGEMECGGITGINSGICENVFVFSDVRSPGVNGGISAINTGRIENAHVHNRQVLIGGNNLDLPKFDIEDIKMSKWYEDNKILSDESWILEDTQLNEKLPKIRSNSQYGVRLEDLYSIEISNANQLNDIRENPNGKYVLVSDIDCSQETDFSPIENFGGILDGNGFKIYNYMSSTNGVFKKISGDGVVVNLTIECTIETTLSNNPIGAIAGTLEGYIYGCEVHGIINAEATNSVGGIAGESYKGVINRCSTDAKIHGGDRTGSIVGFAYYPKVLEECRAKGEVVGNTDTGGIVGLIERTGMSRCFSSVEVSGGTNTGGIAGRTTYSTISDSHFYGDILKGGQAGGIVGQHRGTVIRCSVNKASMNISGQSGGISGKNFGHVKECFVNEIYIKGNARVGGLIGNHHNGNLEDSYVTGIVNGSNTVGGIVGDCQSNIDRVYAKVDVTGSDKVGGIVGITRDNVLYIRNSINFGDVAAVHTVGAIAGAHNSGEIYDCFIYDGQTVENEDSFVEATVITKEEAKDPDFYRFQMKFPYDIWDTLVMAAERRMPQLVWNNGDTFDFTFFGDGTILPPDPGTPIDPGLPPTGGDGDDKEEEEEDKPIDPGDDNILPPDEGAPIDPGLPPTDGDGGTDIGDEEEDTDLNPGNPPVDPGNEIKTVEDLLAIKPGEDYVIVNDIDCSAVSDFEGVESFGGVLDGQGHKVYNFASTKSGIVKKLDETGVIKNLTIDGEITATTNTKGLVVNILAGNVKDVVVNGSIDNTQERNGGIAGEALPGSGATNCSVNLVVKGNTTNISPIIGFANSNVDIKNCKVINFSKI